MDRRLRRDGDGFGRVGVAVGGTPASASRPCWTRRRRPALGDCCPALERVVARYGDDRTNGLVRVALSMLARDALDRGDWARADRIIDDGRGHPDGDTHAGWALENVVGRRRGPPRGTRDGGARLRGPGRARFAPGRAASAGLPRPHPAGGRARPGRPVARVRVVARRHAGRGPVRRVQHRPVPHSRLRRGGVSRRTARRGARPRRRHARCGMCPAARRLAAPTTAGAEAVVAVDDEDAARLFERALALPGAARWPWERARVQLAHGRRLRRGRDSRAVPRSPRTVRTHLYRIFPKLGVASRAGLRDALNGVGSRE